MLKIRQSQFELFYRLEVELFEEWVLRHVYKFFPRKCAELGKQRLRQLIRDGIERAAGHKITIKADVCKYIDLMLVLGPDFDKDGRFPWAAAILKKRTSSGARMRELIESTRNLLRQS